MSKSNFHRFYRGEEVLWTRSGQNRSVTFVDFSHGNSGLCRIINERGFIETVNTFEIEPYESSEEKADRKSRPA